VGVVGSRNVSVNGLALDWAGFSVKAIAPLTEAVTLHRRLHDSEPTNPTYQRDLAIAQQQLGESI
jgi:hypothetical protein